MPPRRARRRSIEEGFDYDGHYAWFARELRHEPNPKRLFHDVFNVNLTPQILNPEPETLHPAPHTPHLIP